MMKDLILSSKKMFLSFLLLILGLSLMVLGMMLYFEDLRMQQNFISDEEVIQRAKSLGMVELKESLINESEEDNGEEVND